MNKDSSFQQLDHTSPEINNQSPIKESNAKDGYAVLSDSGFKTETSPAKSSKPDEE